MANAMALKARTVTSSLPMKFCIIAKFSSYYLDLHSIHGAAYILTTVTLCKPLRFEPQQAISPNQPSSEIQKNKGGYHRYVYGGYLLAFLPISFLQVQELNNESS